MTKLVVIIGFIVAFAAGLVVGVNMQMPRRIAAAPSAPGPTSRPHGMEGFLARELSLTPQQQEQMRQIWSAVAPPRGPNGPEDPRRQFRSERDNAVLALIPADKKDEYDAIQKKYMEQLAAVAREQREKFDNAVNNTKQILTAEQREKYEAFLSRHRSPDRGDRGGRDRDNRRDEDRATSRPATQP